MIYIDVKGKWTILTFTQTDRVKWLIKALEEIGYLRINKALNITESINSGFTYTNFRLKTSIVYISKASSKAEWFNTLVHELKHVQSHICEYYNVPENGEDAAYLIGYIMKKFIQLLWHK